ncbi:hypothetical protein BJ875DRAFT_33281 [Amylocarpus encephaloides]|uniref:Uncharacterized protein n=1 Tax=Amylocarpus encephaloides TaxID=45428 RepID=A0A9P7YRF8_9HELO|nr:hypothetical protein BJ875DRAFT_33281 [Amylocarpus encephaloides]
MATHDELAVLFAQNLTLHNRPYVASTPEPAPAPAPIEEPIIYSISQHYNHSAHIRALPVARPCSEPPQTDQLTAEIILARHGVDAAALSPSQIELFKTGDAGQQMRLVELWRICPPDYGGHAMAQDLRDWSATSFQREEVMAKLRHERQMLEERMARTGGDQSMDSDTMSDSSITAPLTPIQGGDGRWAGPAVEPYMSSGYEALAQREYEQSAGPSKDINSHFGNSVGGHAYSRSTDPVYNTIADIHRHPNVGADWQQQIAMENQYGAFEQQFHHNAGGVTVAGYNGEDEEML